MGEQDKQDSFATVAQEIESGFIDKGLWARAYSEAGGIQEATRARYIRLRADQLDAEERAAKISNDLRDFLSFGAIGIVILALLILLYVVGAIFSHH